jgi:hypothetical protein
MEYRKKPVIIEAMQWTGSNEAEVSAFCPAAYWDGELPINEENGILIIKTLEGQVVASFGDYIIKGVKGEFYPCKPDIFALTYEQAQPAKPSGQDKAREGAEDFATELLDDLYACTRAWSAWSVGTMSEDDFILAVEDDNITSDTTKLIKARDAAQRAQGRRDAAEAFCKCQCSENDICDDPCCPIKAILGEVTG